MLALKARIGPTKIAMDITAAANRLEVILAHVALNVMGGVRAYPVRAHRLGLVLAVKAGLTFQPCAAAAPRQKGYHRCPIREDTS